MSSFFINAEQLADKYLDYLANADLEAVLKLFSKKAVVNSPLYGQQLATVFYQQLFAVTTTSVLTLKDVLINPERQTLAILFHYQWELETGEWVNFEVMDYLELNQEGLIQKLTILYDTQRTRTAWKQTQE